MRLWIGAWAERLQTSLFFVPMSAVVAAIVLGFAGLAIDSRLGTSSVELPLGATSTVDSARALLGTIAGATITFAGIAFSISLLIIQLASSQYSPRVINTLFRDPFNKRVMALVVGTFTFCVVILRSVRSPLESGDDPVIPNLSVGVAALLGVCTILAIVAFIDHNAHAMDVSEILERVRREAVRQVKREWPRRGDGPSPDPVPEGPDGAVHTMHFDRSGWVQQIDHEALLDGLPAGTTLYLDTYAGRYAIPGTPFAELSPPPDDVDAVEEAVRKSIGIGDTRTMQQDASYGLRQLADVALKALSPGINDPTTAQDAIFHGAAVLAELLRRVPPARLHEGDDGRALVLHQLHTHAELIALLFDEVRRAAAPHPTVCVYILEAIELLCASLPEDDDGRGDEDERRAALMRQAELVVAASRAADLPEADLQVVVDAFEKRFGTD